MDKFKKEKNMKLNYILTILITLFIVWLAGEIWFHFPQNHWAFGAFLLVPIVFIFLYIISH